MALRDATAATSAVAAFERTIEPLGADLGADPGRFSLRPARFPDDLATIHAWVSEERARFWGLAGKSPAEVEAAYAEIARTAEVFLGFHGERPAFLVERYRPGDHAVGRCYDVEPGDRGMHVLVGPGDRHIPGFTWAVFRVVMDFVFDDPEAARVVVEPDIRNTRIHALNRRAGFRYVKAIELPTKIGHLAMCTRAQYRAALAREAGERPPRAASPVAHLEPATWAAVNAALVRKMIAELAHELVLEPRPLTAPDAAGWRDYHLDTDAPGTAYRFRARVLALDTWDLAPASLAKVTGDATTPAVDALDFVLEQRRRLGLSDATLPVYLEEIASTLYAAAYKRAHQAATAADLVHADFQELEAAMTEGHPGFIANSGRVGFDATDYVAYAPETGPSMRLGWVAAHRRHAELSLAADLTAARLFDEELGDDALAGFERTLRGQGLDPRDYLYLPVHPWQWHNKLTAVFAPDLAERDLVYLGEGRDAYRPQQSIRTLFNLDRPHRRYVKLALSVLNMGFLRGLSADYMRGTPAINDWIRDRIDGDPFFAAHGFAILREVAGAGYRSPRLDDALPKASAYRKMLAALWRESPVPRLKPGQRLMTMAALLHRDRDGAALLPQLVLASGLGVDAWLDRYLRCYLAPLLHAFYRHDLAFMPHGENFILVLEDAAPAGAFLKDIAEEAAILDPHLDVPERVARLRVDVPDDLRTLSIFTDVFDGILRYVSQILVEQAAYPEARFWAHVAAWVDAYARSQPDLAPKLRRLDLFAPTFARSCLNRLQLRNNRQMVDLADPAGSLLFAGTLTNPIAAHRPATETRSDRS